MKKNFQDVSNIFSRIWIMNNYKYQSVIDFIYKIIASANTNSLQQLPSERTISSILNVSRTTVKYAIDLLVDDRILYKVLNCITSISCSSCSFISFW